MKFCKMIAMVLAVGVAMMAAPSVEARAFNDKLQNRPYADLRKWHLGFSFGAYASDMRFTHNGLVTDDGHQWRVDQPDYQPGFCVSGLVDLRLNTYFSLRFSPGMMFGARNLDMIDLRDGTTQRQNLKSTFVVLPVELKFAGMRYRNARPYLTAGVMPTFDVAKKRSETLKFKSADNYLTVGLGCDFYLPFFKLVPELKFCFGLSNLLVTDRPDLADEPGKLQVTQSLSRATSKMIVLTFYFE